MKIVDKSYTVTKKVYVAEDGTEFETSYECGRYENTILEKALDMYDSTFNKSEFRSCRFVKIVNDKDLEIFKTLCNNTTLTTEGITDDYGVYMWSDNDSMWVNITLGIARIYGG